MKSYQIKSAYYCSYCNVYSGVSKDGRRDFRLFHNLLHGSEYMRTSILKKYKHSKNFKKIYNRVLKAKKKGLKVKSQFRRGENNVS